MNKSWLGHGVAVMLALVVIAAVLFGIARWRVPTQVQREALARMQLPPDPANNGYAAFRYLAYAVPDGAHDALMQEEAAAVRAWLATRAPDETQPPTTLDIAAQRYGPRNDRPATPANCDLHKGGCLDTVRADRAGYAQRLADEAGQIARIEALQAYDAIAVPTDMFDLFAVTSLLHPGSSPGILVTERAFDFAEGRTDAAMGALCTDVTTWRRLGTHTNNLVASMIATSTVSAHARLFGDMLAELPPDHALPGACDTAFAPPTAAELSMCNAMRGEFAYGRMLSDLFLPPSGGLDDALGWFTFDREATDALLAQQFEAVCLPEADLANTRDEPAALPAPPQPSSFDCLGNAAGCILAAIGSPSLDTYLQRRQDLGAALRLADTARRLHLAHPDPRPLAERIRDADAAWSHSPRALRITADGSALELPLYAPGRGDAIRMPLASVLRDQSPATPQSAGSHSAK